MATHSLVRQDHYDAVVGKLVAVTKALKKGNPLQPDTFVGPLISEADAVRIEKWVNDAVGRGAQVLCDLSYGGPFMDW